MIKYKYILFDLDGTISASALGIRKSLEHAITTMNKPLPDLSDYTKYIGPPLKDTMKNLCHFNEEESAEGIEIYRNYYDENGKYLNELYDGFKDLLDEIRKTDAKVAVCSSKYEKFAEEIIDILGVSDYFDAVCGSNLDGSRKDKKDLIPYAVKSLGGDFDNEKADIVMIGDTYFDAKGAKLCDVNFIGVEYGYGSIQRMIEEGAEVFAKTVSDLLPLLSR